ncbi:MAG: glycosyltransferase family 39 protein [Chloroflexi bacterium]|nr:glycosyltransferase family 39 protein [Chloroflexota bacterium]
MNEYPSDAFEEEPFRDESSTFEGDIGADESAANQHSAAERDFVFEDLTLAQAVGLLIYRPGRVSRELFRIIINADRELEPFGDDKTKSQGGSDWDEDTTPDAEYDGRGVYQRTTVTGDATYDNSWGAGRALSAAFARYIRFDREKAGLALLLLFAIIFALVGANILRDAALDPVKREQNNLDGSEFWLVLAGLTFVSYMYIRSREWWSRQMERLLGDPSGDVLDTSPGEQDVTAETSAPATQRGGFSLTTRSVFAWAENHSMNLFLVPVALLLSWLAYDRNVRTDVSGEVAGIELTTAGVFAWFIAIALWGIIFALDLNQLYRRLFIERQSVDAALEIQMPRFRWRWTYLALLAVMLVAFYFRTDSFSEVPPEMTSDHIEKLIDAVKVDNGNYAVFFPNNGGREAFQMYVVAAIADWMGVGFNFDALKYATIIEGLLTVFLSYWVAKEVVGRETEEDDRLGDWVGLSMAALMAISSWHTLLSRLGLRIVLTPLTVLLVVYFLVRAIRYNRRADFIWLGLVLGAGTYFYQANRMLPIVVVIGIGLAIVFKTRWRPYPVWRYSTHLLMTGVIAIVVYLPMYRYSQEFPREFWNRTYGRMFGDKVDTNCPDDPGEFCPPSIPEVLDLLTESGYGPDTDMTGYEAIRANYWDAFTSYIWEGDGQWITNGGGYPALDSRTAALYLLGLLGWLLLLAKRRDIALAVIPVGLLVMILPSALAIAPYLDENPSFTRISGTLVFVFLMAAFPLGMLARQIVEAGYGQRAYFGIATLMVAFFVYDAARPNYDAYFETYQEGYAYTWRPYRQIAAPLKDFAEGRGSFGNAFYVHRVHWLDHRILGSVAGDFNWPNGLVEVDHVYQFIMQNEGTAYAYDPEKPLLFYVYETDLYSQNFLETNFPGGQFRHIVVPDDENFVVYEAPAGWNWLASWATTETAELGCITNCVPGPR